MDTMRKTRPLTGLVLAIGLLILSLLVGLTGEFNAANAMQLQGGLIPDAVDDKYFYTSALTFTVAAPGVLANDTDPENDPRTAVAVTNADTAQRGKYTLYSNGSFTYTKPYASFVGGDFFYYRISDGTSYSSLARVVLQPASAQNVPPNVGIGAGTCMDADCTLTSNWNCTAGNNEIVSIEIADVQDVCTPPICNPVTNECIMDTGIYDFRVTVAPNAGSLYDLGLWVQIDTPPTQTVIDRMDAVYGQNCYKSHYTPVSAAGPWFTDPNTGGPFHDLDGDVCGDTLTSDPTTSFVMRGVSVVCTELLMKGNISAVATWQSDGNTNCATTPTGVCPSQTSKCKAEVLPFEVSQKNVDLKLTKTNVGLTPYFTPEIGQLIDYTIRIDNLPYDDDANTGTAPNCYRSSGYVIEDTLPPYLKAVSIKSAVTADGAPLTASFKCVDESGVQISCDYGSIAQIKIDNNLPTVSTPEPNINNPIPQATCTAQYHTITLTVQYDSSNPRDVAPQYIYNYACVNGFQYDPWGGAWTSVDPITGELIVHDATGNNCDDDNVITEVHLLSFSATPQENAVQVDWETASEKDNLGFNLYRATNEAGDDKVQLNNGLIPSNSPGGTQGSSYSFVDAQNLDPAVTYYYWLEDVDFYGVATLHGPAVARVITAEPSWFYKIFLPFMDKR